MSSQSVSRLSRSVKHGIARLTAVNSASSPSTDPSLAQGAYAIAAHELKSSVNKAGACALSNWSRHAAGIFGIIGTGAGARLGIDTKEQPGLPQTQRVKEAPNARRKMKMLPWLRITFLVYAPDPCMLRHYSPCQNPKLAAASSSSLV
jgi:hypothetical protein